MYSVQFLKIDSGREEKLRIGVGETRPINTESIGLIDSDQMIGSCSMKPAASIEVGINKSD